MTPIDPSAEVTALLVAAEAGAPGALDRVLPLVYDELKVLAASYLRSEQAGHTLQTTGLVHEAYVKLVGQRQTNWQNRSHFFGIAAQAMRQILVDHARRRHALKRAGGKAVTLEEDAAGVSADLDEILAIDEALQRLAALDERQVRIV
jgi:RNA polymerase sigma-70 factor (ECF subfamily)